MTTIRSFKPSADHGAPLHRQVYLILRDGIRAGAYGDGKTLPNEESLARSFNVSRATLRRALADLESDGLIERQQGRGTFVRSGVATQSVQIPMSLAAEQIAEAAKMAVRVIEFDYGRPPPPIARQLGLSPTEQSQRAVRVRSHNGLPIMHLTTHVPEPIGRMYSRADMEETPLRQLLERSGYGYGNAMQLVGATLADPITASLLDCKMGEPLLHIRRVLFAKDQRPVEYLEIRAVPAVYQLRMTFEADAAANGSVGLLSYRSTAGTDGF